jgi:hypothetical protein
MSYLRFALALPNLANVGPAPMGTGTATATPDGLAALAFDDRPTRRILRPSLASSPMPSREPARRPRPAPRHG